MTNTMLHQFTSFDGTQIAVHEMGSGRPLLLLHGYFSDAQTNWLKYGHAETLARAGFRVIMPDLRGHGMSAKPHDSGSYPPDVLADDNLALISHLGLVDFDLGGYSLGGRTVARMLVRGAKPQCAIISGMGLEGLCHPQTRAAYFRSVFAGLGNHKRGSPEWMAEAFLKTSGGDPVALERILGTFIDTAESALRALNLPIGVVCGEDDDDNGSAAALADILPQGRLLHVPGNHMSAVAKRDLGEAMAKFLLLQQ
jgi:pimeloyl-ACP methyl ester carboxylesterase